MRAFLTLHGPCGYWPGAISHEVRSTVFRLESMRRLFVNPIRCTGCSSCVAVCAQRRAGDQDPEASALRVVLDVFGGANSHVYCRQCDEAPCAAACLQGAIRRDPVTGAWVVDRELCVTCGSCLEACRFKAMFWWGGAGGPLKCDLCGGSPACASACRFGAIRFLEPDDPDSACHGMPDAEQSPDLGKGAEDP
jgi:Fe-S-cluster-containing hydrogenase component 2